LALIEKIDLVLGPGLNVLTGETGAGKSIVVDAMGILVGGRASSEQVRTGAEKALVEGYFDCTSYPHIPERLAELGLPVSEDGSLLLARELVRGGRSLCRVNGRIVPLAIYRALGELLVDLHGQHEHQSLLKTDRHRELLDRFAGSEVLKQRSLVENLYQQLTVLKKEEQKQHLDEKEISRRVDYLRYAIEEIERVGPIPGEEEELQQERDRLRYSEKLAELAREVVVSLSEGDAGLVPASDLLSRAAEKTHEMAHYDSSVAEISSALEEIRYKLEDVTGSLRRYHENLEFDPGRAREVEERLYALKSLMRKYGTPLAAVSTYRDQAAAELEELLSAQNRSRALAGEREKVLQRYQEEARILSNMRRERGACFVEAVTAELHSLGMHHAKFDIMWEKLSEPTPAGSDYLEFIFSANPGEPLKPLARIASGGEMSRVMLALKVILAENDEIPTLIFDEIDTGIGGRTLQAVGERLASVARAKQVLCVTHSPHIAGRGQRHFYIEKIVAKEATRTVIRLLDYQGRIEELARMLGGADGEEVTRIHAEQILQQS
jgi:DNA repair protein RecN (Recombination protein N)